MAEWRLQSGQYLGEISALCFVHLPSHLFSSSPPYLLAGTGSQILFYDLAAGNMIRSFEVFRGIRVHGISCDFIDCTEGSFSYNLAFKIAVFGERRVKLFNLNLELAGITHDHREVCVDMVPFHSLPKFQHWVMDVCFLKECGTSLHGGSPCLAIGCSDNSVCFWDIPSSKMRFEIRGPERCLLYSMRMSGDKVEALRIASGTINNEIIVWTVLCQNPAPCSKRPVEDHNSMTSSLDVGLRLHAQHYRAVPICRLGGHEGSIFRIAWSSNGLKLLSVSDDRCARIWEVLAERQGLDNPADNAVSHSVGPVLFGHSARVWDCCISDSLLITAGEDCTCRIWGQDGTQLKLIKENIGRGVWRCLYDPKSSLLVTAGFDSAIKVHQLHASLSKDLNTCTEVIEELIDKKEIFTLRIPNSSEHIGLVDSKSEYVRCLQFTHEDVLYVATNNGYLYHAKISDTGDVKWTELLRVSEEVPIVCMNLLPRSPFGLSCVDDWVAVGDGKGNMTVVRVVGDVWSPKAGLTFTWSAERERQLLGTFWCKSLGYRFIFTADPRGAVKLWRLCDPSHSVSQKCRNGCIVSLVSEFISCFPIRIMCLDASFQDEVLVCGDLRGNLMLFPLSRSLLTDTSISEAKISPMTYFKGAHGISSVCSVSIASSTNSSIEIHSTGGDGCICYMEYVRDQQKLEFIGMKQVKELSLVRSLFAHSYDDLASGNYAIGFASADFIIWNLVTETKVVQIPCGGWRRPHSYYIGDILEMKNCFAFVKDETIYVHKHWLPDSDRKICYPNLHLQFHGREIHSLCFISDELHFSSDEHQRLYCRSSWIATGCEDGTVRLTRYTPGIENWSASKLLGEHVGGSAVRSICSISKMHILAADLTNMPCETFIKDTTLEGWENPFLLISVGAKRVLTAWKQKRNMRTLADGLNDAIRNDFHPSMSFQWLSTDMPTKRCSNHETRKNMQNACLSDTSENDWRYLAVTAFLVKFADSRISVCFVIVACSDATLVLRALILPYRLWFDVALLVPLASPVLSLQHVIIPEPQDNFQIRNLYIVVSGSTDGSIAFWDLTESIEIFMRRVSDLQMDNCEDSQKRPHTGRGSQGGRWWRSLGGNILKERPGDNMQNDVMHEASSKLTCAERSRTACSQATNPAALGSEASTKDSAGVCQIWPLHTLHNVHQSGVNCLHVSAIKDKKGSDSFSPYLVVSGGDDQALCCLQFDSALLQLSKHSDDSTREMHNITKPEGLKNHVHACQRQNYKIRFSHHNKIDSAHSSAVKGVWTDGDRVFSTGLDQRVRCWQLDEHCKLVEQAHLVVCVPEPEALDARACGRNHYQIAVAGRGMQVVEFFAPGTVDDGKPSGSL